MCEAGCKESLETRKSTERFSNGYRRQSLSQRLRDTYFTLQTWLPVLRDVPAGLTKPYSPSTSQSGEFWALLGGVSYCEESPRRVLDRPWPLVWLGGNLRNFVIASQAGIYHWKCSLYHWHKENCFAFDDIFEMVWKNLDIFIRKSIKPKQMVSCCSASFFICSLAIHHPSHPPWTQQRQRLAWE